MVFSMLDGVKGLDQTLDQFCCDVNVKIFV